MADELPFDALPNCPWFDYSTLAKVLSLHPDTVRRMFKNEPDVLRVPPKYRGARVTHRIPRATVVRVLRRFMTC